MQKVHFRLTSVAQKHRCLRWLISSLLLKCGAYLRAAFTWRLDATKNDINQRVILIWIILGRGAYSSKYCKHCCYSNVRALQLYLPPLPILLRAKPITRCGDDIDVQVKRNLLSPRPPSAGSIHGRGWGQSNRGWKRTFEINSNFIESTKKTRLHMYKITGGSREEGARRGRGHRYLIFRPTKARRAENKGA